MSKYKLVPIEPTPEMIDAAREYHEGEAYLPTSLYKAMLAAAPDVQGEPVALAASAQKPVGYVSQDFLDGKWCLDRIAKSDEGQISRTIPVFAKPPQSAEQQPDATQLFVV